jgi:hypothetical protein
MIMKEVGKHDGGFISKESDGSILSIKHGGLVRKHEIS